MAAADGDLDARAGALARAGLCGFPSFSEDGSRIAFISDLSGVFQAWTVPMEGGWPDRVTLIDDQVMGVHWSPVEDLLAVAVAPSGGLNQQIYTVRPDGTEWRQLTDGGKENNWLLGWSPDGRSLMISTNRENPASMDSYLLDVQSGEYRLVCRNHGTGRIQDLSDDGSQALVLRIVNRSDADLWLVDVASGSETRVTPHSGPMTVVGGALAADGHPIFGWNLDGEFVQVEGATAPRQNAELESITISRDRRRLALVWNVGGRSSLELMELDSGVRYPIEGLPETLSGISFSPDGAWLAVGGNGSMAQLNIYLVGSDLTPRRVTNAPHPGVDLTELVVPELVHFQAHDGLELSGWLYRARDVDGPGPVVLDFHGGPEAQARPQWRPVVQALVGEGISVLAPNVRGSSGFGKTFVNLDNLALRFNALRDIESCVRYLVEAGIADPGRIGIMGGSYGGYMTMAGLTEYPDLFAAGVDTCGIVNFATFFKHTEPWMASISKFEYGDPDTQADLLRELSPIHKLDRIKGATLVIHGANDTNVPLIEAEQIVERLKDQAVPVDSLIFPDEGHGVTRTANRVTAMVKTVRWFKQYLSA